MNIYLFIIVAHLQKILQRLMLKFLNIFFSYSNDKSPYCRFGVVHCAPTGGDYWLYDIFSNLDRGIFHYNFCLK